MFFEKVAVIGVGLIGGSFGMALKAAGRCKHVVGCGRSDANLGSALQRGAIDSVATDAAAAVRGADLVLVAAPVAQFEKIFLAIQPVLPPDCLVMDAGSTKRDVVAAARAGLGAKLSGFVPAHPITGKETAGVHNADAALYAGRQVILTPLPQTLPELVQKATDVWAAIGAQVLRMTPENHDAAFASVSHLPHLLAFAYFSAVVNQPAGRDFLSLAGPGFRDFTRIAASDPTIWRDILMANREEILKQSARFRHTLDAMEHVIKSGNADALEDLIKSASEARAGWQLGSPRGGSGKS